jgi:hypothetical protein
MIDVLGVVTLIKEISNPGTNPLWQIYPLVDVYVTNIEVTQGDASDQQGDCQLVEVTSAATVTAAVVDDTAVRNDPDTNIAEVLDLGTNKTGHTGSGGSFSSTNKKWRQKQHVKNGHLMTGKPIKLKKGTAWALKFANAPASSHDWLCVVELTPA